VRSASARENTGETRSPKTRDAKSDERVGAKTVKPEELPTNMLDYNILSYSYHYKIKVIWKYSNESEFVRKHGQMISNGVGAAGQGLL
jgi:hypothetical protein